MISRDEEFFLSKLRIYDRYCRDVVWDKNHSILHAEGDPAAMEIIFKEISDQITKKIIMANPDYAINMIYKILQQVMTTIVEKPGNYRLPEGLVDESVNKILANWKPNFNTFGDSFLMRGNERGIGENVDEANLDVNRGMDYLLAARSYEKEYKENGSEFSLNKFKIAYKEAYHCVSAASEKSDVNSKLCVARFTVLTDDAMRTGLLNPNEKKDIVPQKQSMGILGFFKPAPNVQQEMTKPELLKKIDAHLSALWEKKSKGGTNESYIDQYMVLSAAKKYLSGRESYEGLMQSMTRDPEYKKNDTPSSSTTLSLIDEVIKMHPFPKEENNLRPGF